jgi:hypothetical protein
MEKINDGAVELAKKKVVSADILRYLGAGGRNHRLKTCVRLLDCVNPVRADEIQAKSGIDDGSHHERVNFPALIFQDFIRALLGPLPGSVGIGFPEVNPRTEPIVAVLAWWKGSSRSRLSPVSRSQP